MIDKKATLLAGLVGSMILPFFIIAFVFLRSSSFICTQIEKILNFCSLPLYSFIKSVETNNWLMEIAMLIISGLLYWGIIGFILGVLCYFLLEIFLEIFIKIQQKDSGKGGTPSEI